MGLRRLPPVPPKEPVMPTASQSLQVAAPLEVIWQLLLEKIEDPGKFLQGVQAVEMLERQPGYVVRRMRTAAFEVVERITAYEKSHEVDFVILEHPLYAGQAVNRIEPPLRPGLSAKLTFSIDWRRKDGHPDEVDLTPQVAAAVERTRALAEAAAAGSS